MAVTKDRMQMNTNITYYKNQIEVKEREYNAALPDLEKAKVELQVRHPFTQLISGNIRRRHEILPSACSEFRIEIRSRQN
jgi:hypothetical protein